MLEESRLHVSGWNLATTLDGAWIRTIYHPLGRQLGFVRFAGTARPAWFSWLRGLRLDVYETDDASHLMTLLRPWGMFRMWDVYDADEQCIGSIYPPSLVDSDGERRGYLDLRDGGDGSILDQSRQVIATFRAANLTTLEVTFTADPEGNPFLRMLLLAGILVQDPSPPR